MSIDDCYFEVRDALKGMPELKDFDILAKYMADMEIENDSLRKENITFRSAITYIQQDPVNKSEKP